MQPPANPGGKLGEYSARTAGGDRSTAEVLRDIVGNVQEIIRSEVRLAKAELREEVSKGVGAFKLMGIGAFLGLYALGFLLLSLVYLLATVVAPWLAALIVALVVGGAAAACLVSGRGKLADFSPTPDKTIQNVKENVAWMKDQTRS